MPETTRDRCLAILKKYYDTDRDLIAAAETNSGEIFATHGAWMFTRGKLDSLDRTEYVMALEDEFGIEIGDDEEREFKLFSDVVGCVEGKLAPANA